MWEDRATYISTCKFLARPFPLEFGGQHGQGSLTHLSACNKLNLSETSKVTAPQDAHRWLELQVYLGSNI